jgi:hypothetical protein
VTQRTKELSTSTLGAARARAEAAYRQWQHCQGRNATELARLEAASLAARSELKSLLLGTDEPRVWSFWGDATAETGATLRPSEVRARLITLAQSDETIWNDSVALCEDTDEEVELVAWVTPTGEVIEPTGGGDSPEADAIWN